MAQLHSTHDGRPHARLLQCRDSIDRVDAALTALLRERVSLALEAARIKYAEGVPLTAPAREHAVLARVRGLAQSPLAADPLERIFRIIIDETRRAEFESLFGDAPPHDQRSI
jgi:chorismate mutase